MYKEWYVGCYNEPMSESEARNEYRPLTEENWHLQRRKMMAVNVQLQGKSDVNREGELKCPLILYTLMVRLYQ
jgi:hypothetical protein